MNQPLALLAEHAASWNDRALDPGLEHHCRRALIDWFAALLPGCSRAPATLLAKALGPERGPGLAYCYVDETTGPLRYAALINATASHVIEFDDIYRDGAYHPGCPTIGAALAAAQARAATMDDLLRSILVGYEISCRIAVAVQPSHYRFWHTTGTVGTFGAAAAVGSIFRLDAGRMAHAIATAATMAGGLQQAFRSDGMSKPLHPGHAADAGALAAMAAEQGVTGASDVLDGPAGFAAATSDSRGDWERALRDVGRTYAVANMTVKNHGCCGHIFPTLDAISDLRTEHGFGPDDVVAVRVAGYAATKNLCDRDSNRVTTEQEARFSVQYAVANLMLYGGVRLAAYEPERLADPGIRAYMARTAVAIDPNCEAAFPGRRSAHVEVDLHDGRTLHRYQPTRKGDPDAPLTDADLSAKFKELVGPVLGEAKTRALLDFLWHSRDLPGPIALPRHGAARPQLRALAS